MLIFSMPTITQADILSRVIDPSNPTLSPDAARAILDLGYSEDNHARAAELARRSNEGTLTPDEHREFESYIFVGEFLSLVKSKARLSLQKHPAAA
jgi:hypothetical protein